MKLENLTDDGSRSIQPTSGSETRKSQRGFLASTAAATATVAGLGMVGTAAANDGDAKYITLTNHFDEGANYYLEVSGSPEKSGRYNATIDRHDDLLKGGSAASGHVHNGRDTYRYTGDIVHLGSNEALDLEIDGKPTDPSELLRWIITIIGPDDEFIDYELDINGYFVKLKASNASIDPNDTIASYTADGQFGYGGKDSYATNGSVTDFIPRDVPAMRLALNGTPVSPSDLIGSLAATNRTRQPEFVLLHRLRTTTSKSLNLVQ